jgi:hypothetical protein
MSNLNVHSLLPPAADYINIDKDDECTLPCANNQCKCWGRQTVSTPA